MGDSPLEPPSGRGTGDSFTCDAGANCVSKTILHWMNYRCVCGDEHEAALA
jgi:hypothetical protein